MCVFLINTMKIDSLKKDKTDNVKLLLFYCYLLLEWVHTDKFLCQITLNMTAILFPVFQFPHYIMCETRCLKAAPNI